jgi:hypothetical protein
MAQLAHEKLVLAIDLSTKIAGNGQNAHYTQVMHNCYFLLFFLIASVLGCT